MFCFFSIRFIFNIWTIKKWFVGKKSSTSDSDLVKRVYDGTKYNEMKN